MSIKSFVIKITTWIKSIFHSIPEEAQAATRTGVEITERIKQVINSPVADIITDLIPGNTDDVIISALRTALPALLEQLQLTNDCINGNDAAKIHCGLQTLSHLEKPVQNAFLHSLSVLLAQVAADGKLSWQDGVYLLEWFYQNQFKKQY